MAGSHERQREAARLLARGETVTVAAQRVGVHRSTVYRWPACREALDRRQRSLTVRQREAAAMIAQGRTVTAAGRSVGVHRSTVHRWMHRRLFRARIARIVSVFDPRRWGTSGQPARRLLRRQADRLMDEAFAPTYGYRRPRGRPFSVGYDPRRFPLGPEHRFRTGYDPRRWTGGSFQGGSLGAVQRDVVKSQRRKLRRKPQRPPLRQSGVGCIREPRPGSTDAEVVARLRVILRQAISDARPRALPPSWLERSRRGGRRRRAEVASDPLRVAL